MSIDMRSVPDP